VRRIVACWSYEQCLREAAGRWAAWSQHPEILVIARTRGAADDFARACCAQHGSRGGVYRSTSAQLALEMALGPAAGPAAGSDLAPVSRLGQEALAARSVFACRAERELGYFAPVADTPGFARALASTLAELRLQKVAPEQLEGLGAPGQDLARLLRLYNQELAQRSLADLAARFTVGAEIARRGRHRLLGLPLLLLDAAGESAAETSFLSALAMQSPEVFATALAGDAEAAQALEALLGTPAAQLEQAGAAGTLDRLRRWIFSPQAPPAGEPDESLDFFSAPGEGLECVEMARRARLLAGQGLRFDSMAILLRHPERYLPLVEEALRRAGIPGWFSRGVARPDPAGRAFLALLACAAEDLSAARFAEYLSLGQVPRLEASGAPPAGPARWAAPEEDIGPSLKAPAAEEEVEPGAESDQDPAPAGSLRAPFAWEKLLVEAAVIGGQDRWERRLKGLEEELRLQLGDLEDPGDLQGRRLQAQLERLGHLQRFALPLIERLTSLPRRARWRQWLECLAELAQASLRKPDSVLAMLTELEPLAEVGPVGIEEVRVSLAERLRFLRREPDGSRYGRIFVGAVEEARGRSFEVVFLPGLAEGMFPRRMAEDPLLLDQWREKLDAGLLLEPQRGARERLLLRIAAAAARSRFVASYPRLDVEQGRPRVPSFYALEIWRAAQGSLPVIAALEKRAARAAPSRLGWPAPASPEEALDDSEYDLAFLGRLADRPPEESRGAGRYLLEANPHLARSLRTRWLRWQKPSWSPADGIVDPDPETLRLLASQGLKARSYSPTALEHFAACPYRFLLRAIQHLRPREEAVSIEQLDPQTRGALFHQAQFELFRELEAGGLLPVDAARLPQALDRADRVLDRVAGEHEEKLAPAFPRVWSSEIEQIRIDLRGWLFEAVPLSGGWKPAGFEFGFGLARRAGRDPRSVPGEAVVLDGIRLRGSIDLIERHAAQGRLRVTDHKTGKAPDRPMRFVGGGEVLQPVLYGLAAEQLLGCQCESGALFYATQRGRFTRREIPLSADARRWAARALQIIDQAVTTGFLPAAPRPEACEYCDYLSVCGPYEELRVKKKRPDRLEALNELRCMP